MTFGISLGSYASASSGVVTPVAWTTWDATKDGAAVQFETGTLTASTLIDICVLSTDLTLVIYKYNNTLKSCVVSTSSKTVTANSATTVVASASTVTGTAMCAIDATRAMLVYLDTNGSNIRSVVLSVSGTTVSVGSIVNVVAGNANISLPLAVQKLTTDQCVAGYRLVGTGDQAVCLSTSSTTITVRTPFTFSTQNISYLSLNPLTATTMLAIYDRGNTDGFALGIVLSVSTNTISTPTAALALSIVSASSMTSVALDSTHVILAYNTGSATGNCVAMSISGTTITLGSTLNFEPGASALSTQNNAPGLAMIDSSTSILTFSQGGVLYGIALSVSGTTTTASTRRQILAAATNDRNNFLLGTNRVLTVYADSGSSGRGTAKVLSTA